MVFLVDNYAVHGDVMNAALWLGVFMLVSLVLVSAADLQPDRESGALELLLVTPFTPEALVGGRIRCLRNSYFPAAALVIMCFWSCAMIEFSVSRGHGSPFWFLAPIVAATMFFGLLTWFMPAIGLCFSLSRPGTFAAGLNTFLFAVMIPWLLLGSIFGFGLAVHRELHQPPEFRGPPVWVWLAIWITATAAFQFTFWRASRSVGVAKFPDLMPAWFQRWRIGWITPWALPILTFAFFEVVTENRLNDFPDYEKWLVALWQLSAWVMLIFIGRRCRLALVRMLRQRQFGNFGQ